jgi:hypothetical protein
MAGNHHHHQMILWAIVRTSTKCNHERFITIHDQEMWPLLIGRSSVAVIAIVVSATHTFFVYYLHDTAMFCLIFVVVCFVLSLSWLGTVCGLLCFGCGGTEPSGTKPILLPREHVGPLSSFTMFTRRIRRQRKHPPDVDEYDDDNSRCSGGRICRRRAHTPTQKEKDDTLPLRLPQREGVAFHATTTPTSSQSMIF